MQRAKRRSRKREKVKRRADVERLTRLLLGEPEPVPPPPPEFTYRLFVFRTPKGEGCKTCGGGCVTSWCAESQVEIPVTARQLQVLAGLAGLRKETSADGRLPWLLRYLLKGD